MGGCVVLNGKRALCFFTEESSGFSIHLVVGFEENE